MERILNRQLPRTSPTTPLWLRFYAALRYWQRNLRTRRQLAGLSSRQLADAGISEAQRRAELDKPFWR
jgi:uncharacterized protein YjiS (DUF1127 family)